MKSMNKATVAVLTPAVVGLISHHAGLGWDINLQLALSSALTGLVVWLVPNLPGDA